MRVTLTRLAAFTAKLKEVRIILDPSGRASKGVRYTIMQFAIGNYIKQLQNVFSENMFKDFIQI